MTEEKKVLRQAENKVIIVGTLVEKNLEPKTFTKADGTKNEAMTGDISVRTGENEVHKIRFFANKLTKAGAENKQYKALETVNNEYISQADVAKAAEKGEDVTASVIRVNGSLSLNEFYAPDGKLRQYQQVSGRFVNRLKEDEDPTPKAEFDVEGVVNKVAPEFNAEGDETERALVDLLIPEYGGKVIPYSFVVKEHGKDFVIDEYEKGSTVRIFGDIVNIRKPHKKLIEVGFGSAKEEITYSYVDEHSVSGGTPPYDEDDVKVFDLELIKEAMQQREVYLEQLKNRDQEKEKQQRNSFGSGSSPVKKPGEKKDIPVDVKSLF